MSKILIIEDEVTIAELERDYLELSDFEVTIENTGDGGLDRALKEEFDLIILDVLLNDQTGLSLLQRLHSTPHSPPVVVYTQSLQKDIIVKVLSAGAASFLVKPQKPNVLIQKCLSILKVKE